jgi:magnesium transporter
VTRTPALDGGFMLSIYVPRDGRLERIQIESGLSLLDEAVWIDLVAPTVQEDKQVEALLGIEVPTRAEMQEIEVSSRLYVENGGRYMTATLMCQSDTATPMTTPVTFILSAHRLVTVRYDDPRPFAIVGNKLARVCSPKVTGETVLMDILDAVIDRSADIQERIGVEVDQISHSIFEPDNAAATPSYNEVLKALGRKGDLTSKVRESQVSVGRLLSFLAHEAEVMKWRKDVRAQLQSMQRDVISLSDHATYLASKITFLLEALLGVVNIQQNAIIKIFSIAAVVFMPPTLVASIYGMNFHHGMIELDWSYGYPFALTLIVLAAIVPLVLFKWKKWL